MLYVKCFIAAFLSVLSIVIGKMLLTRDDNGTGLEVDRLWLYFNLIHNTAI